jgi:hypothetical protein
MEDQVDEAKAKRLNSELLASDSDDDKEKRKTKQGTKDDLITKINKVVDEYNIDFEHSQTRLRRMTKTELTKVLAFCMEQCVKQDMAKAAGCDPRAGGKVITLNALRMLHNLCATGFEQIGNRFVGPYVDMEIEGFAKTLQHPDVQPSIDECLTEIAAENPEVLEYFDSPYSRLMLVWSGVLMTCIKKRNKNINNDASHVEFKTNRKANSGSRRADWGSSLREEHRVHPPLVSDVVKI